MMRTVLAVVGIAIISVASLAQQPATKAPPKAPATSATQPNTPLKTTVPKAPAAAANWPSYCSPDAGFCIKYPGDWKKQTDVLQGAGVVVAKAQPGIAEDFWPQITAAATFMPEEPEGKEAPSFDDVLNVVLESIEPGAEKQTLQRSQTIVDGLPAQLVKIKYVAVDQTWIEEGLFIDGDDAIYSVVLRSSPQQLAAVEPVFMQVTQTWRQYAAPAKPASRPATAPPAPATPTISK